MIAPRIGDIMVSEISRLASMDRCYRIAHHNQRVGMYICMKSMYKSTYV